jgi:DNA-binding PadR family transcriptional regulator
MAEGRSAWWRDVWVSLTKDLIKDGIYAVLGLLLLSALVKSARDWLLADSHVMRGAVVLLVVALFIAIAYILRARNQGRAPAPAVEAPRVPPDFNPTGVQLAAMGALLKRYDQATSLAQLHEYLKVLTETAGGKPFLARQMEDLGRANVLRIDETGRTDRNYHLTVQGRDWLLDQIKDAREHPEAEPQVASQATPPASVQTSAEDFMWSPIRGCVLAALLDRMDKQTDIEQLHAVLLAAPDMELPLLWRERLARDLEAAERAGIVRIERPGGNQRYYYLTARGRDWLINKVDEARAILTEHNRLSASATPQTAPQGAQQTPQATPQVPARFAPETFELTPPRCRALLVLRHRVDARTTLHDLHNLVTDDGTHIDRQTTKAQLQHDMEAAERAGIVSIERVPGGYADYYRLTIPAGRDWVLSKQHELQAEAGKGLIGKERGPRYS